MPPVPGLTTEFSFVVSDARVTGPDKLQVQQGYRVRFTVDSDVEDILHLHGYELWVEVEPGKPAVLDLPASYSGRFELELHQQERVLGYLEVSPLK